MGNKLYVGNLSFNATEDSLSNAFNQFGSVSSCKIITDRETGRSKGFAFVEMSNSDEANAAISGLDGNDFDGRPLRVNEAKPREDNRGGGNRRW